MQQHQIRALRRKILRWYQKNGRDLPWRHTSDPYLILVSEIMLQQTQVTTVIPFYRRWLERFPTIEELAAAPEDEVLHAWQGLGYYTRARNLHAAAKLVTQTYGGVISRDPESLRSLPGMGRYTANAVATFAFDQSVPIVEANIARLLARLFNVRIPIDSTPGRERLWKFAATIVPKRNAGRFNSALMDLGATICTRSPQCHICPVKIFCRATRPDSLPVKRARPKTIRLAESYQFVRRDRHLLLERCKNRWRGMWMLPKQPNDANAPEPIYSSVFPFTNHRITLRVFRGSVNARRSACPTTAAKSTIERRWMQISDLHLIAIPSPHRRAINACLSLDVERPARP